MQISSMTDSFQLSEESHKGADIIYNTIEPI